MQKPKILHIGGSHSTHVADLVNVLNKNGYKQCVLSYRKHSVINKNVPVYFFPYVKVNVTTMNKVKQQNKMSHLIKKILVKEKIDIIHSHFIFASCYITNLCAQMSKAPLLITPWAIRSLSPGQDKKEEIQKCFNKASFIMLNTRHFFTAFKKVYKNLAGKFFHCRLPLDLSRHHDKSYPSFTNYRILAGRTAEPRYKQDLLLYAVKELSSVYDIRATFIVGQYAPQGRKFMPTLKKLANKLGIANKCTFINNALNQKAFSELIREHNIAYSIAPDCGLSQTTVQCAYAGLITIIRNNPFVNGVLKDKVNILRTGTVTKNLLDTGVNKTDIMNTVAYAIKHKNDVQEKFFKRNRELKKQSVEYTLPKITNLYRSML